MKELYGVINKDKQIIKFCFYGFFKNLKFFEPYLFIYLASFDINLFQFGILFSISQITVYIFEIPSGVYADRVGKRKTLCLSFIFYIISFIIFFFGKSFILFVPAMIIFGLGEAFRSGTHKAMILTYLENKNWYNHRAYVYGRTRSFSLLGSAISAILSIIIVLSFSELKIVFIFCIIPYVIDFLLILSYPKYLDGVNNQLVNTKDKNYFYLFINSIKPVFKCTNLRRVCISASTYEGIYNSIKDFIQPILKGVASFTILTSFFNLDNDTSLKLTLGLIYFIFNIFSSIGSKNIYRLSVKLGGYNVMRYIFDITYVVCIFISIFIKIEFTIGIIIAYFIIYIIRDSRRPAFLDTASLLMDKDKRATTLSVESQMQALFGIIFAPLFGFIADRFSLSILFIVIAVISFIINRLTIIKEAIENNSFDK